MKRSSVIVAVVVLLALGFGAWLGFRAGSPKDQVTVTSQTILERIADQYFIVTKTVILDIPQMAMAHGIVNAFGFALCGLVGWSMVEVHGGRP